MVMGSSCAKRIRLLNLFLIWLPGRRKCHISLVFWIKSSEVAWPLTFCSLFMSSKHYLGHRDTNVKYVQWEQLWLGPWRWTWACCVVLCFCPSFPSFISFPLLLPFFPLILPLPPSTESAVWHTGSVHLLVDSVPVILCGVCWRWWPVGVLWCNDPCHCLSLPPVSKGEKWIEGNGAGINTHKEMHWRGTVNLWMFICQLGCCPGNLLSSRWYAIHFLCCSSRNIRRDNKGYLTQAQISSNCKNLTETC